MRLPAALKIAMMLTERPASVRWIRQMPLPSGITQLLEVATGELTSIKTSFASAVPSPQVLQTAAIFFVEQILLAQGADSYRILGCQQSSTRRELRRHMVLLIKLLHPDNHERCANQANVDGYIYFRRVTQAWQNVRNTEQREAYDEKIGYSYRKNEYQPDFHRESQPTFEKVSSILPAPINKFECDQNQYYHVKASILFGQLRYYLSRH